MKDCTSTLQRPKVIDFKLCKNGHLDHVTDANAWVVDWHNGKRQVVTERERIERYRSARRYYKVPRP